jgi:hypothetical protein
MRKRFGVEGVNATLTDIKRQVMHEIHGPGIVFGVHQRSYLPIGEIHGNSHKYAKMDAYGLSTMA